MKTETQGECQVVKKADIDMMHLQPKKHQSLPGNHQKVRQKHGTDSPSHPSEGTNHVKILISDF